MLKDQEKASGLNIYHSNLPIFSLCGDYSLVLLPFEQDKKAFEQDKNACREINASYCQLDF